MSDTINTPQKIQTDEHKERYFRFQIKGWANFDPTDRPLSKIAESVDQGNGILNLVEVLTIEDDLAAIDDDDVRECFANILAAKRLVRTIRALPENLREQIRLALKAEDGDVPKKTVASVASLPGNGASVPQSKQWP
jgi:hypothetical protein